jgi:hypothetical protein
MEITFVKFRRNIGDIIGNGDLPLPDRGSLAPLLVRVLPLCPPVVPHPLVCQRLAVRALKKQKKEMLIREKKAMRERAAKHRLEIKRLRQEKLEVENEQLRQQMKHKTIELANKARDNKEKNR